MKSTLDLFIRRVIRDMEREEEIKREREEEIKRESKKSLKKQ